MNEDLTRVLIFVLAVVFIASAEYFFPRRRQGKERLKRWPSNFGVVVLGAFLSHVVFPVMPFSLAVFMNDKGWGLLTFFNFEVSYPGKIILFILSILIFDMAIYFQHRAFHHFRILWFMHRMHHADTVYDFTTGIRFHPLEIILSTLWKLILVVILGPPAMSYLAFEVILNSLAMFNHANLKIPVNIDKYLRFIVVTPDTHRVHHSVYGDENNRNFGFNFPWWDRIFKTYKGQPRGGHENMLIGLNLFRNPEFISLINSLRIPFIKS